jgi:putative ABC transport system permease protein
MAGAVLTGPAGTGTRALDGGGPARRAMMRWAWRLFRHEWRQQLLILALVVVAVGAIFVGGAVAVNTPSPSNSSFGTATDAAVFQIPAPHMAAEVASIEHRFGRVDIIENQQFRVPGSIDTYDLRSQDPHGAFGGPMLSLVSGRYPAGAGEVAVTSGVASDFRLSVGDNWTVGGVTRRVVGIVENPQSLLDAFALVTPGQVTAPTSVTVLFDAPGIDAASIGPNVTTPALVAQSNPLNPVTILLALTTLGMLLIGLVSIGGFTVLAQRRLRAIGMIGSLGATDRHIRLVVRANGAVVGIVGAVLGFVLGMGVWLVYRPHLEQSAHHLIGTLALPWQVIFPGMALAVVATYLAATRPARSVTRMPIVAALSGRPAPPKDVHRSAIPGALVLVVAFLLMTLSGEGTGGNSGPAEIELVLGFVALTVGIILFAPMFISAFSRVGSWAPVAVRLALRDLARYRSRSGSALSAISLGVMIAAVISVVAAARYGNSLDYAGPNLAPNQLLVYANIAPPPGSVKVGPNGAGGPTGQTGPGTTSPPPSLAAQANSTRAIATALGATGMVELDTVNAGLNHAATGRNWNGPLYVATPQLLRLLGIPPSAVNPSALVLTMRPGIAGMSQMQLLYDNSGSQGGGVVGKGGGGPQHCSHAGGDASTCWPCPPGSCIANPAIQYLPALPSGTSAPNSLITEHAVQQLHLQASTAVAGWFVVTPHALTGPQIYNADQIATRGQVSVETKSDAPSSAEVINWATVFGIALSLTILAMTIGLIRSETAGDLRTLTAAGAGSFTRRMLTGATAGGLALLGAVLGTAAAYVAAIGWFRSNTLNGGVGALSNMPISNLLVVLIGMPVMATVVGWLIAGRQPPAINLRPLE